MLLAQQGWVRADGVGIWTDLKSLNLEIATKLDQLYLIAHNQREEYQNVIQKWAGSGGAEAPDSTVANSYTYWL